MLNLNEFRTDPELERDGMWVDFGGGAEIKIASLNKKDFVHDFQRKTKTYTDAGREIPSDFQESIMNELLSKHIVIDWKNIYDGDKEFKYSIKNCEKLLKELPSIKVMIINEAKKIQNFVAKQKEETEKN